MYSIVRNSLESKKAPVRGLIIDIIQLDEKSYVYRLYRENVEEFPESSKLSLFEWIKDRAEFASRMSGMKVGVDIADKPE